MGWRRTGKEVDLICSDEEDSKHRILGKINASSEQALERGFTHDWQVKFSTRLYMCNLSL